METWILFWTIIVTGTGVVSQTQEFNNRERCEWAAQRLQDTHNVGIVITGCFPKN